MRSPDALQEARDEYADRCAICHGKDGNASSDIGSNLYPKAPDLRAIPTQSLTDGEIHYIIKNGVRLTGMPAMENAHMATDDNRAWELVLFIRSIAQSAPQEKAGQIAAVASAHYVGSAACQKCHAQIYNRWKKTPMANVVRDPSEHPDAIIPNLATNNVSPKFSKDQVAFVYGNIWKQRDTSLRSAMTIFPEGNQAQWDVVNKTWRPYMVANGTDWWATLYPPDNMKRPTGATCDGCHSVGYDVQTKQSGGVERGMRTMPRCGEPPR